MSKKPAVEQEAPEQEQPKEVVAEVKTTALTQYSLDDEDGTGLEDISSNDILVPRLTVLQALSPQVNKKKPEYIEGAEPGIICDIGTGELYPKGIEFLLAYWNKVYIEWAPRESGKGLQAIHQDDSLMLDTEKDDKGNNVLPNGNVLVETYQMYGLNLTNGGQPCFIPMSSTNKKCAKKMLTTLRNMSFKTSKGLIKKAPVFYCTFNMEVADMSNNNGDWSVFKPVKGRIITEIDNHEALIMACKTFATQLHDGRVKVDHDDDSSSITSDDANM